MDKYLYRISTKRTDVWSNKIPKPVYIVAQSKESAESWAAGYLTDGLSVSKITRIARQLGETVFASL